MDKHFLENPGVYQERSVNIGFKSNLTPTQNKYLQPFENDSYDMACNTKFKTG